MAGDDSLRRDDMRPPVKKEAKLPRIRVMYAVISDGSDKGAYATREKAQAIADTYPDGYVTECMRRPTLNKE